MAGSASGSTRRRNASSSSAEPPADRRRNASFADPRWQPSGPTLALRKGSVAGPFGFLNPTTALYDIQSNDRPGGARADLTDLTDAERQERAKVRWNARDYRKGRHILILPRAAPLTSRLQASRNPHSVLLGISRMFTLYPYWDVSWWIGISFTIGCLLFVIAGFFYWLPIAYPETEFPHESDVAGGVLVFIGATLFQIGAVLLFLESYNDRAETQFGGAMEDLFVNRLGIVRRGRHRRHKHFDMPTAAAAAAAAQQGASPDTSLASGGGGGGDGDLDAQKPEENGVEMQSTSSHGSPATDHHHHQFEERKWQWWPSWHDVTTHYMYEIGFLASFTMSVGATVFYISGILALPGIFNHLSKAALQGAYFFPYLLGGLLFAVSSVLYILETQPNWYTPQPFKIGWHVGVWNMIGGVGWTLAASWGYCSASWCEYQSELALIWASAAFSVGSALQWYESLDKYVVIIER
ncbi:endo-polygalacturonase PG1 [Purpureocillium lavendulum]|uniref:Endo-polygalacturonase PG1 n=1 Tax=Purpureocillium lavendulum TaxID=1247861 RepID=A0AB34FQR4_9HYPO|nr:endo-polygalacturonase PG1 [Purpureocillium lavendulum]